LRIPDQFASEALKAEAPGAKVLEEGAARRLPTGDDDDTAR
jgi:hypothetical protein